MIVSRLKMIAICTLCAVLLLSGCAESATPEDLVRALVANEIGARDGRTYYFSASEGNDAYLSDDMLLSLYGFERELSGLSDGAIYLSGSFHPCEFAVFACDSTATAEDIALYLRSRLDTLDKNAAVAAPFCDMTVEEYRAYIENAAVVISGRYVALIISSDTPSAKKAFYRSA